MTSSKQRNRILKDVKGSKFCVFKVHQHIISDINEIFAVLIFVLIYSFSRLIIS